MDSLAVLCSDFDLGLRSGWPRKMKVSALNKGSLYAITDDPRVCVVEWAGYHLQIVRYDKGSLAWIKRTQHPTSSVLQGAPALYCGPSKNTANAFKQGYFTTHKFLIKGHYYYISGEHIQNIVPIKKVLDNHQNI